MPNLHGRGTVKTVETVCYEIMREMFVSTMLTTPTVSWSMLLRQCRSLERRRVTLAGGSGNFRWKQVKVQIEPLYNQEQFDVVICKQMLGRHPAKGF